MRHKKKTIIFLRILSAVIIFNLSSPLMAKSDIYAIGCIDNYPYEYINDSGTPAGFSVELINEIAKELKRNCRIELVPYDRFVFLKQNPEVDILLGLIRGEPDKEYEFFKTNLKINFSIFTNSDSIISSLNDLRNMNVIIAGNRFIANPILEELKKVLIFKSLLQDDEMNAFTLLKRRKCDAVFMSGPSARKIIENQNLIGIKEIPVNIGYFDYGFGIRKNKGELQAALTEGYNKVFLKGEYDHIYRRWFIENYERSYLSDTGIYVSAGIFSFMIFIFFILINSFVLRKRIREKTEELQLSMNELSKTEIQLKESENRFKKIFNKSPSALMILNSSGRVLLFNEAVVKIFGVNNPHEITNLDVINSPVSTEWFKSRLKNCRNINLEVKFDFGIIRETGYYSTSKSGIIILEIIVIPIEINTGGPEPGYICQFSDNTAERGLVEEIKYNQRKLELIFESVKDGLWEWNISSGKVRYNRKFFSFLGYKMELYPDDINTLFGFIHDSERESVKTELYEKVLNGRSFNIEYRMVMSNGKIVNVRSRGETIEWDDNLKPLRVIGIQTEITMQRDITNRLNFFKSGIEKIEGNPALICEGNILNDRTILIVDDNYLIYLYISELLKKYNAKSLYAANGLEAIHIVKGRDDISMILMDHFMPGMDGVSALKEIRIINQSIPVVIQTGQTIESISDQLTLEGFNGVLEKPVEENLLIETICSVMEKFFYKKN